MAPLNLLKRLFLFIVHKKVKSYKKGALRKSNTLPFLVNA